MSWSNAIRERFKPLDFALIAAGAGLFNLLVFGSAALLQREVHYEYSPQAYQVQPFLPPEEPPPPEPEKRKPPEPEKPPQMEAKPLKTLAQAKERPALETPLLALEINPKLSDGLDLGPRPPLPKGLAKLDQQPVATNRLPPPYPFLARRRGIEGVVAVRFLVNKKGRVSRIKILRARPENIFENTVRQCVARWRFRPGLKEGRPVDTWVETSIVFKLDKQ